MASWLVAEISSGVLLSGTKFVVVVVVVVVVVLDDELEADDDELLSANAASLSDWSPGSQQRVWASNSKTAVRIT
jgi:hypothetical protein